MYSGLTPVQLWHNFYNGSGHGGTLGLLKQIRELRSLAGNLETGSAEVRELLNTLHCTGWPFATESDPVQNVKVPRLHNPAFADERIEGAGPKEGPQQ